MRKNQTSLTAMGIAIARAMESEKPEGVRICYDPYARRMVPAWFYHLTSFFIRSGYAELRGPGVNGFLVARDRYIDDALHSYLNQGIRQLVLLGAGFDSRPYRFPELAGRGVRVFEVDHPVTQQDKLARLRAIFGRIPEEVTFVPVDFASQSLEERLLASGYDPSLKTFFIWQGVTMYLDPGSVDATLAFIVCNSAAGSAVIFDYIFRSVLQGEKGHGEVSGMRRYRGLTGEPLSFGIEQGTVEAFLGQRGFTRIMDVDSAGLRSLYFTGKNAARKIVGGYGIVSAEVGETTR